MPAVALEGLSYLQSLEKWKGSGDFSLDPIISVMNALGNPQDKPKCIHIGGTNGKGTLGASLSGLLTELGSPVGYYHSPTLGKLSEGFLVNGRPVSDRELSDAALKVRGAANTVGVSLSQFEALTASGFILFEDLEWSIIEVGLGGR